MEVIMLGLIVFLLQVSHQYKGQLVIVKHTLK